MELVNSIRKDEPQDGLLLIDGWKNSIANTKTVVAMLHLTEFKITLQLRLTKVIISYGLAANFLHPLYKGHRFINNAHRLCNGAREMLGHIAS